MYHPEPNFTGEVVMDYPISRTRRLRASRPSATNHRALIPRRQLICDKEARIAAHCERVQAELSRLRARHSERAAEGEAPGVSPGPVCADLWIDIGGEA